MKKCYPKNIVAAVAILCCFNLINLGASGQAVATFSTPGTNQQFTVPAGVTSIQLKAWGGAGGAYADGCHCEVGGGGGFAGATITVTPGETLTINVGGGGGGGACCGVYGGGINGGGTGGGGGGGFTGLLRDTTYLLIAGGGGGSGNGTGGVGGGLHGGDPSVCGNSGLSGGSQTGGGEGQCPQATNGTYHQGGYGNQGGGGGGYYGGGGGSCGCGGGGGSGYVTGTDSTLIAAPGGTAANSSDPNYNGTAGNGVYEDTGNGGLLVILYNCTGAKDTPTLQGYTSPCTGVQTTYYTDSGTTNYVWSFTGGDTIIAGGGPSADSVTVEWKNDSTGTVSVSYAACGSSSGKATLTVHPLTPATPEVSINANPPGAICYGDSITFTGSITNPGLEPQYFWYVHQDRIPGADSTILTLGGFPVNSPTTGDSDKVIFEVISNSVCSTGFYISEVPYSVTVKPIPVALITAADTLICTGDSTQICTSNNFIHYLWNTGDTTSCISGHEGAYYVQVTDTNGCSNTSMQVNVQYYPNPGENIVVSDDTLVAFGYLSYQWYFNGQPITGADSSVEIADQSGNYALLTTDSNGCRNLWPGIYIAVTSVNGLSSNETVSVYPNPASGKVFISSYYEISEIRMYNVTGQEVSCIKPATGACTAIELETGALAGGIYELQIFTGKAIIYKKLSVESVR